MKKLIAFLLLSAAACAQQTTFGGGPGSTTLGTATAAVLSLPTPVNFTPTQLGSTSAAVTIPLTNIGTKTANLAGFVINTGANPGDFVITGNNCGGIIAIGNTCSVFVTFIPTAIGTRSANFVITSDALVNPSSVLVGTGLAAVQADSSLLPNTLTFPDTSVGVTSSALTLTLASIGTSTLNVSSYALAGTNAADYAISGGTCGAAPFALAPAATCTFTITITPSATGLRVAQLNVVSDDPSSPTISTFSGNGVAPAVSLTASLAFPDTVQGVSSSPMTAVLTNTGTATLTISSINVTGANSPDFPMAPATTCNGTLAASASCNISITFTPTAAAARTAQINVTDNASGSPHVSTLSGNGIAAAGLAVVNTGLVPGTTTFAYSDSLKVAGGTPAYVYGVVPTVVSSSFTNTATGWKTPCFLPSCNPGGTGAPSSTSVATAASPSLDGLDIHLAFTTSQANTNVLYSRPFGVNNNATQFVWDHQVYVASPLPAQIEMDIYRFDAIQGINFMFGTQCNRSSGKWDVWRQDTTAWVPTSLTCNWTANTFHHIIQTDHIDNATNNLVFDSISIDGVVTNWNISEPSGPLNPTFQSTIGVQYQGNCASCTTFDLYADQDIFTVQDTLPKGLGPVNPSTGVIAGTPTTPGTYNFTAQVTDAALAVATKPLSIVVAAASGSADNRYCQTNELTAYPGGVTQDDGMNLPVTCVRTDIANTPSPGSVITVAAGDATGLQSAMNTATCGQTVRLTANSTYTGSFTIPANTCDNAHWITYTTSGIANLPPEGNRLTPCYAGVSLPGRPFTCSGQPNSMAKIKGSGVLDSALTLAPGASHIRFIGIEVEMKTVTAGQQSQNIVNMGPSVPYSATVTVNGAEQSTAGCGGTCFDVGAVYITINGVDYLSSFGTGVGQAQSTNALATGLAAAITAGGQAVATASSNVVTITAPSAYSLATHSVWDSIHFGSPSFTGTRSGANLAGGQITNHIIFDRVWIHGIPHFSVVRAGFMQDGVSYIALIDSSVTDIHCMSGVCTDSQIFQGGAGNQIANAFEFHNNYVESAGTNSSSFGGSAATIMPRDFFWRRNYQFKPPIWNPSCVAPLPSACALPDGTQQTYDGLGPYSSKNMFEIKNVIQALVEGNVMENCYMHADQSCMAILLTPKNQSGNLCPLCVERDITIRFNHILSAGGFLQMVNTVADDGGVATEGSHYSVHDNLAENLDFAGVTNPGFNIAPYSFSTWDDPSLSGASTFLLHDGHIRHNTVLTQPGTNMIAMHLMDGTLAAKSAGMVFNDNIAPYGNQGINQTSNNACAGPTSTQFATKLNACWSGYSYTKNAIIGGVGTWPAGNLFPSNLAAVGFVNTSTGVGGDYRLCTGLNQPVSPCAGASAYHNAASDGKDIGADMTAMYAATANVSPWTNPPGPPTWSLMSTPAAATQINDIAMDSSDNWYLADRQSGCYFSNNQGLSWSTCNTGLSSILCRTLTYDSVHNQMLLGCAQQLAATPNNIKFYRAPPGGGAWTLIPAMSISWQTARSGAAITPGGLIVDGGFYGTNGAFWSSNSGVSTTAANVTAGVGSGINVGGAYGFLYNSVTHDCWMGTEQYGMFRASDCKNYVQVSPPDTAIDSTNGLRYPPVTGALTNGNCYGVVNDSAGAVYMGCSGGIWKSSGACTFWTEPAVGGAVSTDCTWTSVFQNATSSGTRVMGTDNLGNLYWGHTKDANKPAPIYRSTDKGATWPTFSVGLPNQYEMFRLLYNPNDGHLYTVIELGSTNAGFVYRF